MTCPLHLSLLSLGCPLVSASWLLARVLTADVSNNLPLSRRIHRRVRCMSSSRFMFLFPGQGAQQQGMAACLVKHSLAEVLFNRANEAAGYDVRSL